MNGNDREFVVNGMAEPCPKCLERMSGLEQELHYSFDDKRLLFKALTHSSYAHEHPRATMRHNERLEFLGDSVLGTILADYLFRNFTERWEGELTLMKSWLVSESSLASIARQVNLGYYMLLGTGEDTSGGRDRAALLADALEALIGAVYLDGGMDAATEMVMRLFGDRLHTVDMDKDRINYKNELQSVFHSRRRGGLDYRVTSTHGPDHRKAFEVEVRSGGEMLGRGSGASKKEAEMSAAQDALLRLEHEEQEKVEHHEDTRLGSGN